MTNEAFEHIAAEEFSNVPKHFARRIQNVALLVEDEPSNEVRHEEGLRPNETLLGLYHGIPANERGDFYSGVLPDTITLFRLPLLEEAVQVRGEGRAQTEEGAVRLAIRETLWHEIGHYFGLDEAAVHGREASQTNYFYAQGAAEGVANPAERSMLKSTLSTTDHSNSALVYMTKTLALIFGIILMLLGVLGFVSSPLIGVNAIFATDAVHNGIHFIFGATLLFIGLRDPSRAALWLKIIGAVTFLLGLIGILTVPASGGTLIAIAYTNGPSNWFHIVIGVAMYLAGTYGKDSPVVVVP